MADPYAVLGVSRDATPAEITAAYRRAVRACHPDTEHPDPGRLAAVIAAYRMLRAKQEDAGKASAESSTSGSTSIPVRVHRRPSPRGPDLRAGPARHDP
ncbi:J domain-containing protein [Amycolatopsis pigmentata]|uniref:J domain-containing protein n=1 Tax=Amycolatopsis pigmentata TaxID=450801 RepID=A0ABW5FRI5_9PSEU